MNVIDLNKIIEAAGFKKSFSKVLAKKFNIEQDQADIIIERIFNNEIDKIGESLAKGKVDESDFSRLRGLSLKDFMEDNDKIIKDE